MTGWPRVMMMQAMTRSRTGRGVAERALGLCLPVIRGRGWEGGRALDLDRWEGGPLTGGRLAKRALGLLGLCVQKIAPSSIASSHCQASSD